VSKVGAEGAKDPYMQLTHANVVMAALPAERSARNPADKQRERRDWIYKVRADDDRYACSEVVQHAVSGVVCTQVRFRYSADSTRRDYIRNVRANAYVPLWTW
jgi:hypothetical protein